MRRSLTLMTMLTCMGSNLHGEGFCGGTVVRTIDGYKCIEELQPGDTILSVKGPFHKSCAGTVRAVCCFQDWPQGELSLSCGGCCCAPEQRFCSADGSWVRADRLMPGDKITTIDGALVEVLAEWRPEKQNSVYSISVEPGHTLIVEAGQPLLAHNLFIEVPVASYIFGGSWQLLGISTLTSVAAGALYMGAEKVVKWANTLWQDDSLPPNREYDSTVCIEPIGVERFEAHRICEGERPE